jgi:hypothetical protein
MWLAKQVGVYDVISMFEQTQMRFKRHVSSNYDLTGFNQPKKTIYIYICDVKFNI